MPARSGKVALLGTCLQNDFSQYGGFATPGFESAAACFNSLRTKHAFDFVFRSELISRPHSNLPAHTLSDTTQTDLLALRRLCPARVGCWGAEPHSSISTVPLDITLSHGLGDDRPLLSSSASDSTLPSGAVSTLAHILQEYKVESLVVCGMGARHVVLPMVSAAATLCPQLQVFIISDAMLCIQPASASGFTLASEVVSAANAAAIADLQDAGANVYASNAVLPFARHDLLPPVFVPVPAPLEVSPALVKATSSSRMSHQSSTCSLDGPSRGAELRGTGPQAMPGVPLSGGSYLESPTHRALSKAKLGASRPIGSSDGGDAALVGQLYHAAFGDGYSAFGVDLQTRQPRRTPPQRGRVLTRFSGVQQGVLSDTVAPPRAWLQALRLVPQGDASEPLANEEDWMQLVRAGVPVMPSTPASMASPTAKHRSKPSWGKARAATAALAMGSPAPGPGAVSDEEDYGVLNDADHIIHPDALILVASYGTAKDCVHYFQRYGNNGINYAIQPQGFTALHCAVRRGDADMVKTLLEYGSDPNTVSASGATALWYATQINDNACARQLVSSPAFLASTVNAHDTEVGCTPLMWAALRCNLDMMSLLISEAQRQAVSVPALLRSASKDTGTTLLSMACVVPDPPLPEGDVPEWLLEQAYPSLSSMFTAPARPASTRYAMYTPSHWADAVSSPASLWTDLLRWTRAAAKAEHTSPTARTLSPTISPSAELGAPAWSRPVVQLAARRQRPAALYPDVQVRHTQLLRAAKIVSHLLVQERDFGRRKLLLCQSDRFGWTALHFAASSGLLAVIQWEVLSNMATKLPLNYRTHAHLPWYGLPTSDGSSNGTNAAQAGPGPARGRRVRGSTAESADPSGAAVGTSASANVPGYSVLHLAVWNGRFRSLHALLAPSWGPGRSNPFLGKCKLDTEAPGGYTPLDLAVLSGNYRCARLIARSGSPLRALRGPRGYQLLYQMLLLGDGVAAGTLLSDDSNRLAPLPWLTDLVQVMKYPGASTFTFTAHSFATTQLMYLVAGTHCPDGAASAHETDSAAHVVCSMCAQRCFHCPDRLHVGLAKSATLHLETSARRLRENALTSALQDHHRWKALCNFVGLNGVNTQAARRAMLEQLRLDPLHSLVPLPAADAQALANTTVTTLALQDVDSDRYRLVLPLGMVEGAVCACPKSTCRALAVVDAREKAGYKFRPNPIDTSAVQGLDFSPGTELHKLVDSLAENSHSVWAAAKMNSGWTFGAVRDDNAKRHPQLKPYSLMSDDEKSWDITSAQQTIRVIRALGYMVRAESVSNRRGSMRPMSSSKQAEFAAAAAGRASSHGRSGPIPGPPPAVKSAPPSPAGAPPTAGSKPSELAHVTEESDGESSANAGGPPVAAPSDAAPSTPKASASALPAATVVSTAVSWPTVEAEWDPATYTPEPVDTSNAHLTKELAGLVELLAADMHNTWAEGKMKAGFTYAPAPEQHAAAEELATPAAGSTPGATAAECKTSPLLVPYSYLTEEEKEMSRASARELIKTMLVYKYVFQLEPGRTAVDPDSLTRRGKHDDADALHKQNEMQLFRKSMYNVLLYSAARVGCAAATQQLLTIPSYRAGPADVSCQDALSRSPLYIAVERGHVAVAEELVRCGANVSMADMNGVSPLIMAAITGQAGLVQMLLDAGARLDECDALNLTALHHAAWLGHAAVVKLLIRKLSNSVASEVRNAHGSAMDTIGAASAAAAMSTAAARAKPAQRHRTRSIFGRRALTHANATHPRASVVVDDTAHTPSSHSMASGASTSSRRLQRGLSRSLTTSRASVRNLLRRDGAAGASGKPGAKSALASLAAMAAEPGSAAHARTQLYDISPVTLAELLPGGAPKRTAASVRSKHTGGQPTARKSDALLADNSSLTVGTQGTRRLGMPLFVNAGRGSDDEDDDEDGNASESIVRRARSAQARRRAQYRGGLSGGMLGAAAASMRYMQTSEDTESMHSSKLHLVDTRGMQGTSDVHEPELAGSSMLLVWVGSPTHDRARLLCAQEGWRPPVLSPLSLAVAARRFEVVLLLLRAGADPVRKDGSRLSPYQRALLSRAVAERTVVMLSDSRAEVDDYSRAAVFTKSNYALHDQRTNQLALDMAQFGDSPDQLAGLRAARVLISVAKSKLVDMADEQVHLPVRVRAEAAALDAASHSGQRAAGAILPGGVHGRALSLQSMTAAGIMAAAEEERAQLPSRPTSMASESGVQGTPSDAPPRRSESAKLAFARTAAARKHGSALQASRTGCYDRLCGMCCSRAGRRPSSAYRPVHSGASSLRQATTMPLQVPAIPPSASREEHSNGMGESRERWQRLRVALLDKVQDMKMLAEAGLDPALALRPDSGTILKALRDSRVIGDSAGSTAGSGSGFGGGAAPTGLVSTATQALRKLRLNEKQRQAERMREREVARASRWREIALSSSRTEVNGAASMLAVLNGDLRVQTKRSKFAMRRLVYELLYFIFVMAVFVGVTPMAPDYGSVGVSQWRNSVVNTLASTFTPAVEQSGVQGWWSWVDQHLLWTGIPLVATPCASPHEQCHSANPGTVAASGAAFVPAWPGNGTLAGWAEGTAAGQLELLVLADVNMVLGAVRVRRGASLPSGCAVHGEITSSTARAAAACVAELPDDPARPPINLAIQSTLIPRNNMLEDDPHEYYVVQAARTVLGVWNDAVPPEPAQVSGVGMWDMHSRNVTARRQLAAEHRPADIGLSLSSVRAWHMRRYSSSSSGAGVGSRTWPMAEDGEAGGAAAAAAQTEVTSGGDWGDAATRWLSIDMSLFNPHVSAWLSVRCFAYFPNAGNAKAEIRTQVAPLAKGRFQPSRTFQILFGAVVLWTAVVLYRDARRKGWGNYLKSGWDMYELASWAMFAGILIADVYVYQLARQLNLSDWGGSSYINVWRVGAALQGEIDFVAIVTLLTLVRLGRYLQLIPVWGSMLQAVLDTAVNATVLLYLLVMMGILFVFAMSLHVALGLENPSFATLWRSMLSMFGLPFAEEFTRVTDSLMMPRAAVSILYAATLLVCVVLVNIWIALVSDEHPKASKAAGLRWEVAITDLMQDSLVTKQAEIARNSAWRRMTQALVRSCWLPIKRCCWPSGANSRQAAAARAGARRPSMSMSPSVLRTNTEHDTDTESDGLLLRARSGHAAGASASDPSQSFSQAPATRVQRLDALDPAQALFRAMIALHHDLGHEIDIARKHGLCDPSVRVQMRVPYRLSRPALGLLTTMLPTAGRTPASSLSEDRSAEDMAAFHAAERALMPASAQAPPGEHSDSDDSDGEPAALARPAAREHGAAGSTDTGNSHARRQSLQHRESSMLDPAEYEMATSTLFQALHSTSASPTSAAASSANKHPQVLTAEALAALLKSQAEMQRALIELRAEVQQLRAGRAK